MDFFNASVSNGNSIDLNVAYHEIISFLLQWDLG